MKLVLTVTVQNFFSSKASEEEKNEFKAINILKKNEDNKLNCKLDGINRKDLK